MKKVLSVALVLVMIFGCFSVMASAVTTDAVLKIYVEPTQATYSKGDEVTFEVSYERSDEIGQLGVPYSIAFGFDSSVFEPIEDLSAVKNLAEGATSFIYEGYPIADNIIPAVSSAVVKKGATDADTAKGWDSYIMFKIGGDNFDDYTNKTASFAFKLKVKDDANPSGSYLVGVSDYAINNGNGVEINEELGSIFGTDTAAFEFTNPKMFATVDSTVNVASATASILKPMSSQIRFKGVGSDGNFTNYGGTFDVRTRATISTADFNAKFTDEATAKAGISEFGFIYKAASVGAFDLATAKGVAQGTAAEGYVKKTCNYIQRTAEGYNFTCLIQGIADADHTDVVSCIAYVCFNGEYIFFDAPATADYNALYTTYHK